MNPASDDGNAEIACRIIAVLQKTDWHDHGSAGAASSMVADAPMHLARALSLQPIHRATSWWLKDA